MTGSHTFLPWARAGAAVEVADVDETAGLRNRAQLTASLTLDAGEQVARKLPLLGPGDVAALDPRQVVRVEPRPDAVDFPPEQFPLIEMARLDLPWLFTPARPTAQDRLRPWLVLAVVEWSAVLGLDVPGDRPPVLRLADAAQLPPLDDAAAWAHVYVAGDLGGRSPWEIARDEPGRAVARLLAPRRLRGSRQYLAALVPAFKAGVLAGLGRPVDPGGSLDPAWTATTAPVELPVYYHWRFATGPDGDFAALARRLRPVAPAALDPAVGRRPIDASDPGDGLPVAQRTLWLGGALRASAPPASAWGATARAALAGVLNGPGLTPPIYGRWHAARRTVDAQSSGWLAALNLDPVHRVAAALGTAVVQREQESLMEAAWRQIGDVRRANDVIQQAQLGREVNRTVRDVRLAALGDEPFLAVAAPLLARTAVSGHQSASGALGPTRVPPAALSAPLRRLARPRGPLGRRLGLPAPERGGLLGRLNARDFLPPAARPPAGGGQGVDPRRIAALNPPGRPAYSWFGESAPPPDAPGVGSDSPDSAALRGALAALRQSIDRLTHTPGPAVPPTADLGRLRTTLHGRLDPEQTVARRVGARLRFAGARPAADDPLAPVMAAPRFTAPMARELAATSTELLLPGLERVPPESVVGLETNPEFIEAYMVGLNHEVGRELLWRGYPTDQRGTCFARFWDRSRTVPPPTDAQLDDVATPLAEWDATSTLGSHLRGGAATVVILIRGSLLRRYPGALLYLAQAVWVGARREPTSTELHPTFRGSLDPDVTFMGFDLPPADAKGDPDPAQGRPGWFLVIQEQPAELRFGLHDDPTATQPPQRGALAWQHLGDPEKLTYAPVKGVSSAGWPDPWGPDSAHVANACRLAPLRLAIHADDVLP